MALIRRLRAQPLRTKLALTAVGTAVVVFGVASSLTFRYWREESEAAAAQQALLAAASVRSSVEAGLSAGEQVRARAALHDLVALASISAARVYATDGTILVSSNREEEGTRPLGVWIPSPRDLPARGVARTTPEGDAVNAFLPVRAGGAAVIEVHFSLAPLRAAMDRAARLGLLLVIGSLAAVVLIVATVLEREVVTPIERVADILGPEDGTRRTGMLERIEESVTDLIRKGREAERKAAEQERRLAHQAGFAELGEMAAEMAHEFKRPLASIRSAVSLLEQEYELNDEARALLAALDGHLGKLGETMRDLFALARPVEIQGGVVVLPDAVDGALVQLAGMVDTSRCRIERRYAEGTPVVRGDQHRIEQAVLNIMLNAVEAMERGGALTVTVGPHPEGALLEFADTGGGIPEAEIEKVVLPFYSTKPSGTGLGLPLVARVVAAHGGRLDIRSEAGRGTTVAVLLPARRPGALPVGAGGGEGEWRARAS